MKYKSAAKIPHTMLESWAKDYTITCSDVTESVLLTIDASSTYSLARASYWRSSQQESPEQAGGG